MKNPAKNDKHIKCDVCKKTRARSVDHIVPRFILNFVDWDNHQELHKQWSNLVESKENKRYICVFCNSIKGHKLDLDNPTTKQILTKMLELIK